MATRTALVQYAPNGQSDAVIVTWAGLLQPSTDSGTPFEAIEYADRSVQLAGTLGTGGEVTIQGSNDGANWAPLSDPQGIAIKMGALGISAITELTRYIRPLVSGGDGTTDLTVTLLARRQK